MLFSKIINFALSAPATPYYWVREGKRPGFRVPAGNFLGGFYSFYGGESRRLSGFTERSRITGVDAELKFRLDELKTARFFLDRQNGNSALVVWSGKIYPLRMPEHLQSHLVRVCVDTSETWALFLNSASEILHVERFDKWTAWSTKSIDAFGSSEILQIAKRKGVLSNTVCFFLDQNRREWMAYLQDFQMVIPMETLEKILKNNPQLVSAQDLEELLIFLGSEIDQKLFKMMHYGTPFPSFDLRGLPKIRLHWIKDFHLGEALVPVIYLNGGRRLILLRSLMMTLGWPVEDLSFYDDASARKVYIAAPDQRGLIILDVSGDQKRPTALFLYEEFLGIERRPGYQGAGTQAVMSFNRRKKNEITYSFKNVLENLTASERETFKIYTFFTTIKSERNYTHLIAFWYPDSAERLQPFYLILDSEQRLSGLGHRKFIMLNQTILDQHANTFSPETLQMFAEANLD